VKIDRSPAPGGTTDVVNTTRLARVALLVGPAVAVAVGGATATVRGDVGSTIVGVSLAIVVTVAALISRTAAIATAVAAAVTFNFFHTEPYHSLRIHEPGDVAMVALLLGLGFLVSDVTGWMRRRDRVARQHLIAVDAAAGVPDLLGADRPILEVWPTLASSLLDELSFASCRFVPGVAIELSLVADSPGHEGEDHATFVLPAAGAAVPIRRAGRTVGHLVLTPQAGNTSLTVRRSIVHALAATVAAALLASEAPTATAATSG
jgi:K+-sensing histidine kinase KdpD